jgi:RHS repeat-associated protein
MTVSNKNSKADGVKGLFLNNIYKYDAAGNITSVENTAALNSGIGGTMTHEYKYDDWYRLIDATGKFVGSDNKSANYHLEIGYDNLYNITSKKLTMTQTNLQFAGKLSAGHEFNYIYSTDNPMQLASVETKQYNVDGEVSDVDAKLADNQHVQSYEFDANGNMTSVSVASLKPETQEPETTEASEDKDVLKSFLWDEENRLLAVNNNGSVSCYFYDAAGERTVKLTSETEMVHVNGKKVGGNDAVTKFTAYVSPYFVVSNGGAYTKHIYAASQRIASKLGNEDGFGADPRRVEMAGGKKISDIQKDNIGARYKELGFTYSAPEKEKVEKDSTMDSEEPENLVFFYHPDHLGSTSYVTDADGNIAQHIEYIPYGEVFVEERNNSFSTNYLFNAKELDNETGLYYYGARYLDPTVAMWLSVDPMWEKYAGISPYAYCLGNPLKLVDPTGRDVEDVDDLIKTFERVNGKISTCGSETNLREDSYSSIKDICTSDVTLYSKSIPVGKDYRNAYSHHGGCGPATLCSILDMFGVDKNTYDRVDLDDSRLTDGWNSNIKQEFDKLNISTIECFLVSKEDFVSLVSEMKANESVYAMLFNTYGTNGEVIPHNVVVTGVANDGKIQYWDNATGIYGSTSVDNMIQGYQFISTGSVDPWGRYQMNINYDSNKYFIK